MAKQEIKDTSRGKPSDADGLIICLEKIPLTDRGLSVGLFRYGSPDRGERRFKS